MGAGTGTAATGLEPELVDVLAVFIVAGTVGVFVAKFARVPYTIALLIAGFVASLAGFETGIRLTHDVIIFVLLPPLLFEGAATTDLEAFRRDFPVVALLAVVGLAAAVIAVGAATAALLGFPLLIALLFAVTAMPTDPVSVLALFEEIGAPERFSVLVEGESLLNDGVAVVLLTIVLAYGSFLFVLVGRALAVYPLTWLANRFVDHRLSLDYQHVMLWGGLHASIPIALVLGLPPEIPFRQEMQVMVFGVTAFSLVVQGLTIRRLVEGLGITTVSDEERLYQLLVGRARAVDRVLEAADELAAENRLPTDVYERFTAEYEAEKDALREAISRLLRRPSGRERRRSRTSIRSSASPDRPSRPSRPFAVHPSVAALPSLDARQVTVDRPAP